MVGRVTVYSRKPLDLRTQKGYRNTTFQVLLPNLISPCPIAQFWRERFDVFNFFWAKPLCIEILGLPPSQKIRASIVSLLQGHQIAFQGSHWPKEHSWISIDLTTLHGHLDGIIGYGLWNFAIACFSHLFWNRFGNLKIKYLTSLPFRLRSFSEGRSPTHGS